MLKSLPVENERPSGKPGFLFLVIPAIFYRASIFALFRLDPRSQPAGMTTGFFRLTHKINLIRHYPSLGS
jgi:hypothetical protein